MALTVSAAAKKTANIAAVIFLCLLFAVTIPLGLWVFSTPAVLSVAAVLLFVALRLDKTYQVGQQGIFWTALGLTYLTAAVDLVSPVQASGLMEIWFLCLVPILLIRAPAYLIRSNVLKVVLGLIFLNYALGLVYAAIYGVHYKAVLYQFAYNLKLPLMMLVGLGVGWSLNAEKWLMRLAGLFVVYCYGWVGLQLASYSAYRSVARGLTEISYTSNPLLLNLAGRFSGPFIHSGILAISAAFWMGITLIFILSGRSRGWLAYFVVPALFGLMLVAGQQQEVACAVAGGLLLIVIYRTRISSLSIGVALASLALGIVALLIFLDQSGQVEKLTREWGVAANAVSVTSARPVLYIGGFVLASQYFPFGTGLGSYAGVGAKLFDRDLYEQLGFSRYWWYREDKFLLDTYWPNFIAETGWLGALLIVFAVLLVLFYSFYKAWVTTSAMLKRVWSIAFFTQLMSVGNSLTAPSYSDPNLTLVPFIFLGIAITLEIQSRLGSKLHEDR